MGVKNDPRLYTDVQIRDLGMFIYMYTSSKAQLNDLDEIILGFEKVSCEIHTVL